MLGTLSVVPQCYLQFKVKVTKKYNKVYCWVLSFFLATDLASLVQKGQISQISANALSFPRPRVAMLGLKPSQGKPGAWKTLSMSRKFSNLALLDLGNKIW